MKETATHKVASSSIEKSIYKSFVIFSKSEEVLSDFSPSILSYNLSDKSIHIPGIFFLQKMFGL